jgi:hypothetical protein
MRSASTLFGPGAISLIAAAVPVAFFYVWTASSGLPFGFGEAHDGLYNLQAQALARGQLHLAVEPRPELFELAEPYEPGRNAPFRLLDASLYHGRYYLYFGVVPVLLAFLPWLLLGLGDLPEPAAAVAFGFGCFVFAALLLRRLLSTHLPDLPVALHALLFLAVGLFTVVPFALRGPQVYEVAICAGALFAVAAAWCFLTAAESGSLARLALGGLSLGLAIGCRANHLVLAPLLPLLASSPGRPWRSRGRLRVAVAVVGPLAVCLLALGLYNRARFDSWTEFGARYQLMGARPVPWFDYRAMPPTLFVQFLAPPAVRSDFPFVVPYFEGKGPRPEGHFLDYWTTGVFAHSPFLLILFAFPWILRGAPVEKAELLRRRLLLLLAAGLALPLVTSYAFGSVAMRFQVDFVPFLLVPSLVLWLLFTRRVKAEKRVAVRGLAGVAFGWSALAAVALSLHGASDDLRNDNPALFASLEARVEPVRVLAARLLDPDSRQVVRLRAAFPERLSANEEPLLSWGSLEAYDVLWVRQPSPEIFVFSLDAAATRGGEARIPRLVTRGFRFAPGRFHDLVLDLDRARRRVRATVDGTVIFDLPGRLVPVHRNRLWPGRGPRGHGAPVVGRFSGSLIPEAMISAGPPGLEWLPPITAAPALLVGTRVSVPARADPGQMALVEGQPGAWLFTGTSWRWIPRAFVDRVRLERPFTPPGPAAGDTVPILVSGDAADADAVVARRVGGGRMVFAVARWKGGWTLGPSGAAVVLHADRPATVSVTLDRPGRAVVVALDGQEALRSSVDLLPLGCDELRGGRLPAGTTPFAGARDGPR